MGEDDDDVTDDGAAIANLLLCGDDWDDDEERGRLCNVNFRKKSCGAIPNQSCFFLS